jgi:transposase-like protein
MISNPLVELRDGPKAPRVLMRDGEWIVPVAQRPSQYQYAPLCPSCGNGGLVKAGKDRRGHQRLLCNICLRTVNEKRRYLLPGMYLADEKLVAAKTVLLAGRSIRQAARIAGIAQMTARKIARTLGPRRCECGQDARHRGWCPVRFQESPVRQAVVARFNRQRDIRPCR